MARLLYYITHITQLTQAEYLALLCMVLLFFVLAYIFYSLINHMTKYRVLSKGLENLYRSTEKDAEERKAEYEKQLRDEGVVEKEDVLMKLDMLITHSGLKNKISFLNAEIYIIMGILLCCIGFLIVFSITKVLFYGLAVIVGVIVFQFGFLMLLSNHNRKKIEENIVNFVNLVENYSKTSDDIINIFGKVYPFLEEPLRSDLELCYAEGMQTGNVDRALENLSKRVNHKKFREIIRNLEICSRYEANYEDVAEDSRSMLMEYLAGKRERMAMINSARIELALILGMGVVLLFMMSSFVGVDGTNVITVLTQTFIGNVLLVYSLIVVLLSIINIVLMGNMKD